ncbi:MAG: branched-chain amino acid transport system permease protein [Actinomycetota bacterium]|nr:branched-chain amino acid transport system permease protein [Actinomycetota bacterium]MDQ1506387.1 branched-chain amino acid transport system permease protein [Actinomycetota bacterium]
MVIGVTAAVFESAVIIGIFTGTIYAMMALGIVASFRINRVVNLGIPGIAVFGATVYFEMSNVWGAPVLVALLGGVAVGGLIGALLGVCNLKMTEWPRGFVMIFTLTVSLFLFGWSDKILPPIQVSPASPFGDSGGFKVALTYVSNHQIGTFITCILVTLLMGYVVSKTRIGIYVRAIYDDGDSAATLGIPLGYFVVGVWAVAGALAALAGILVSPRVTLDPYLILFVTIWALAGSILGGLESFGIAFVGSILVGLSQGILGGGIIHLGPGLENLGAIAVVAIAVFYAGVKRRDLAHIQT